MLGRPISHSLSPVLHRTAYAALGLTGWRYDALDCGAAELPALLKGLGAEWVGLSLTMPLKETVLPLLDEVRPRAAQIGAVNTVLVHGDRWVGDNTDVDGIAAAIRELPGGPPDRVTVLGGGGTARAALAALAGLEVRAVQLLVRRPAAAPELIRLGAELGLRVTAFPWPTTGHGLPPTPLVVSTVPAGATDALADAGWPEGAALVDVVYAPWPTSLAAAANRTGAPVVGGLAVLVGQAVAQVRLMTGKTPPAQALRDAGEAVLAARAAAQAAARDATG